jgi:dihydroflavonol-4-reductase
MILVTGATGHIGNVLVRQLLALGKKVRAFKLPGEDMAPLRGLEVDVVEGDVLDQTSLQRALEGVKHVYHLAGVISILSGVSRILDRVNVQGTRNVIAACREAAVERLVYTSSIHALAEAPHGAPIDERQPFDPARTRGDYGRSKAQASLEVVAAARQGLNAVIVCPTGVIGPYDFRRSEMSLVIGNYARRTLKLYVEGAYNFVDVRDVAAGHILACERGRVGESYILAGERITVKRLLETVEELTGRAARAPHVKVPFWLARWAANFTPLYYRLTRTRPQFTALALHTLCSNSEICAAKAQRELGYTARALRDSLKDTLAWFNANSRQALASAK